MRPTNASMQQIKAPIKPETRCNAVFLASGDYYVENIIDTVVISELKFRDVQRHVFGTDLVERAVGQIAPSYQSRYFTLFTSTVMQRVPRRRLCR
jgi:hypothetical protein